MSPKLLQKWQRLSLENAEGDLLRLKGLKDRNESLWNTHTYVKPIQLLEPLSSNFLCPAAEHPGQLLSRSAPKQYRRASGKLPISANTFKRDGPLTLLLQRHLSLIKSVAYHSQNKIFLLCHKPQSMPPEKALNRKHLAIQALKKSTDKWARGPALGSTLSHNSPCLSGVDKTGQVLLSIN